MTLIRVAVPCRSPWRARLNSRSTAAALTWTSKSVPLCSHPSNAPIIALPRTPLKETERRAANFESRFGVGATELDALQAVRPGELERILTAEIERYYDFDLDQQIHEAAHPLESDLTRINREVRDKHAKAIASLEADRERFLGDAAFAKKAAPIAARIAQDLRARAPDLDAVDWPEPADGDEDLDPLFNSTRDYLEQIDRYKLHQGKPTASIRAPYKRRTEICVACGKPFQATSRAALQACSNTCRRRLRRAKAKAQPCPPGQANARPSRSRSTRGRRKK